MVEAWPGGGGGGGGGGGRPVAVARLMLLLLLGCCCWAPVLVQGRRLICWQAMLQCQEEPECSYAYSQYAEACAPVLLLAGEEEAAPGAASSLPSSSSSPTRRRRCPSHCISALIQLNHTRRGPALEDCDCDRDENCRATKRAIEPCLPRTGGTGGGGGGGPGGGSHGGGGVMGCTEARRRCDWDSRCSVALSRYMSHCGKLFNGLRCTEECRGVIEEMLAVPKALLLNDCVCDGLERPICESIKENMARLCFGDGGAQGGGHQQHRDRDASSSSSSNAAFGPGSSGALDDYYDEEEEEEEEDYEDEVAAGPHGRDDEADDNNRHNNAASSSSSSVAFPGNGCPAPWTLLSSSAALSILGPLLLLLLFLSSSS